MEFNGTNNSGLLKYRSAPTSLLADFTNLSYGLSSEDTNTVDVMKKSDNSCNKPFFAMNSQLPPQYPSQYGVLRTVGSVGIDYEGHGKISSSLARQNSSPAGLFSQLNPQNDYCGSRLRNHTNFSSSGMLSRISEVADEPKIETNNCEKSFSCYGSWGNDYSYYAEYFPVGIKREIDDDDRVPFANSQTVEHGIRPHILSHHFSLPKSSAAEFGAMEKLLHFQDRVPCKVRAKRGFATHPRSIAERVRRTKISERMRKLQDLVPNMDKQTNTADMLDFAVEYIKDLQKQYKALRELRASCKCSASENVHLNRTH